MIGRENKNAVKSVCAVFAITRLIFGHLVPERFIVRGNRQRDTVRSRMRSRMRSRRMSSSL